jgi:two-component system response regulator RegA
MSAGRHAPKPPRILVVDDDQIFRSRLIRALEVRGHDPIGAESAEEAVELFRRHRPPRAVVDLKMPGKSGLDLITDLAAIDPDVDIVVLTGYGSITTAVEAVRRGAIDYLTKPADTDQILARFEHADGPHALVASHAGAAAAAPADTTPTLARVEWEHIQRILDDCNGNISLAARKLGIHRRSLQRKLTKFPPLE